VNFEALSMALLSVNERLNDHRPADQKAERQRMISRGPGGNRERRLIVCSEGSGSGAGDSWITWGVNGASVGLDSQAPLPCSPAQRFTVCMLDPG
jgi:hypothetical protein